MEGVRVLAASGGARALSRDRCGRASEPEIDPSREEGLQCAELLGDDQRRVVGQHDPPAPMRNVDDHRREGDHDGRGGARDPGML